MARMICEYCGTEYEDTMPRCPLCGTVNEAPADEEPEEEVRPVRRRARSGGARLAPGEEKIPRWLMVLICVVLGIAVVIGAIYALYALGAFSSDKEEKEADPPALSLPVTDDEGGQGGTAAPPDGTAAPTEPATTPSGPVECVSLVVSPDAVIHLADEGMSQAVTVTVLPSECIEPVVWSSSDESVCQVDDNGYITAVDGGQATVTVTCGKISREIEVSCDFQNSKENNATLSLDDFTLTALGDQATLIVNNPPRNARITWRSEDTAICTVDDGVVTAKGNGTTNIIAIVNDKELTCIARCNIPGYAPANDGNADGPGTGGGNKLDHTDVTLSVGDEFEISVVNGVSGGWNVTDGSIISVNGNGIVKALASGTAKVYTILGNERLECIVRVK